MQISEAVLSTSAEAPLLHVNWKWTFGMQRHLGKQICSQGKGLISGWPASLKNVYYEFSIKFCTGICALYRSHNNLSFFLLKGNNVGFIKCPDGGRCKNGQTCCYLASHRSYGCCDKPRAVCCRGKMDGMCCSHGYR